MFAELRRRPQRRLFGTDETRCGPRQPHCAERPVVHLLQRAVVPHLRILRHLCACIDAADRHALGAQPRHQRVGVVVCDQPIQQAQQLGRVAATRLDVRKARVAGQVGPAQAAAQRGKLVRLRRHGRDVAVARAVGPLLHAELR